MRTNTISKSLGLIGLGACLLTFSVLSIAADENAAKSLARQNGCFRCHSVSHAKDGPAWNDVANKMRSDPNAEAKLIHHITSGENAKFPDGHVEKHKIIQADNPAQIKNLIDWILSLK